MKTEYEVCRRPRPNVGYTDKRGTFDTLEAAAHRTSRPDTGAWLRNGDISYVPDEPDAEDWLIAARQIPENAAERAQLALGLIARFRRIDGKHHQVWVLDQVARILAGDGYRQWVAEYCDGENEPETYSWDEGTAP